MLEVKNEKTTHDKAKQNIIFKNVSNPAQPRSIFLVYIGEGKNHQACMQEKGGTYVPDYH